MPAYHEDPSIFPMEGGCSCGLLRYRIAQAPIVIHCCHCTACQRETGTAFAINAIIESTSLEQLAPAPPTVPAGPHGEPPEAPAGPHLRYTARQPASAPDDDDLLVCPADIRRPEDAAEPTHVTIPSESGRGQSVARCPGCGTCVWTHYAGAGSYMAFIKVGTLDQAWRLDPDVHIYTRSKRGFVAVDDGAQRYEAFYPDYRDVYRPEAIERFEKLLPEIRAYRESAAERAAKGS